MKLYAKDGTQLSWGYFWLAVVLFVVAWVVLGGIPVGIAALIWGADVAGSVASVWLGGVLGLLVYSLGNAWRQAKVNYKKYGVKN